MKKMILLMAIALPLTAGIAQGTDAEKPAEQKKTETDIKPAKYNYAGGVFYRSTQVDLVTMGGSSIPSTNSEFGIRILTLGNPFRTGLNLIAGLSLSSITDYAISGTPVKNWSQYSMDINFGLTFQFNIGNFTPFIGVSTNERFRFLGTVNGERFYDNFGLVFDLGPMAGVTVAFDRLSINAFFEYHLLSWMSLPLDPSMNAYNIKGGYTIGLLAGYLL